MLTDLDRIRALDARALRLSGGLVRHSTVADLARPTPCAGWDLGALLAHMTAQHRGFAAAARGAGADPAAWAVVAVPDPQAAYEAAAADVTVAFAEVGAADQPFALPEFGAGAVFPADRAIGFHALDYVVHAWDVAATLDVLFAPDADLLDAVLPLALAVPDSSPAFAPRLAAGPDAGPLPRLLTRLGRTPRPSDR